MRVNQITIEPVVDLDIALDCMKAKAILTKFNDVNVLLTKSGYMHVAFNIYSVLRSCADEKDRRRNYRFVFEVGAARILCKHLIATASSLPDDVNAFVKEFSDELL